MIAALLLSTATSELIAQPDGQRPSVIMIYTDDMGYGDISSFSDALPVTTPNIDRLATDGMKFTQFYVSMPICSPSRAAVLSGMYSPRTRLTNYLQTRAGNNNSDGNDWMDPDMAYLPLSFQDAGYATAHVGKWHLGGGRDVDNAPSIAEYGYDEFWSTWESPNPDPGLGVKFSPWNKQTEPGQIVRHRRTEYMVDKTLDFMQRHADQSCFITLWPDDLHTPFRPSPEMILKYNGDPNSDNAIANFYGVLEEYDRQIGRLLDGLETQGRTSNTIVFFTGDNGPSPPYANHLRTNGLRGRKLSLYEGGIREPFLIRWPGNIPAGVTNSTTIMSTIDLLRTLTALAGIPLSAEALANTDGEDLSAAVLGETVVRSEPLFWEYGRTSTVPRPGAGTGDRAPILAMRDGDFKLLVNKDGTGAQLYNVVTDPNETSNIASNHSARVNSMKQQVITWSQSLPGRNQPYPAFQPVSFGTYTAMEVASVAGLQNAAGATSTARISGVTCDPNGRGDVFVMHEDLNGRQTILRLNDGVGPITKIADSESIANDLVAPTNDLTILGGFQYSPGGNRIFLADSGLGIVAGQVGIISVDVATGQARLIARTTNLSGLLDHTVLLSGALLATRGGDGGNRTVGQMLSTTGGWTQKLNESQLLNAAPGQSEMIPAAIVANLGAPNGQAEGEVFLGAKGAIPGDFELFQIPNPQQTPPTVSRQSQASLSNADLVDLAMDQAGNTYAVRANGAGLIIVRGSDGGVFFISSLQMQSRLGSPYPIAPTEYRGISARMRTDEQADVFLADSTGIHGIIRLTLGTPAASIEDWSLYASSSTESGYAELQWAD